MSALIVAIKMSIKNMAALVAGIFRIEAIVKLNGSSHGHEVHVERQGFFRQRHQYELKRNQ